MNARRTPGWLAVAVGVALVAAFAVDPPVTAAGGPAAGYGLFVVVVLVGGGYLAVAVGVYSLRTGWSRPAALLLAAYGSVGVVYGVIRLRLLASVPAVTFAAAAACLAGLVLLGTLRLTAPRSE